MKIKLAKYLADFLVEKGFKDVFTVTGGGAMHLNDALGHHPSLKCTYNHHEQGCAIAAEGYARFTGEPAAACVTSGPGGTNALTGVVGGWLDSIPMFVVSGQVKRETTIWSTDVPLRQLGDQEFNIVDCVKSMTKYAVMVTEPNDIKYHLERAYYLCKAGRPGPVWLDIPLDVQAAVIDTDKLREYDCSEDCAEIPPVFSDDTAKEILERIANARRPVIFAGSAIRTSGIHSEFIKLIDKLGIPVVTAWNAHDDLWDEHPCFCGRPGSVGTRGGNFVVQNSDLILSLGCRLNIRQISYNWDSFARFAYKIVVDIDEGELNKPTLKIDMKVHADVRDVVGKLNELLDATPADLVKHAEWLKWARNVDAKYPAAMKEYFEKQSPVNPYVFVDLLFDNLAEGDSIICGNGSACVCTFQAAKLKPRQRLFTNSGCASMGYGLPAALGVAVAKNTLKDDSTPHRVVCLDGDGSIQMNLQELQTIIHNNLDMKIFWLNNSGYHSIRQTQTNLFNPPLVGVCDDNGVSFPDAGKIATAYGFKFFRSESLTDMNDVIKNALEADGSVICEVVLDPEQYFAPKLSSKVLPDGKIVSPPIEDMYPFLDREEFESNMLVDENGNEK